MPDAPPPSTQRPYDAPAFLGEAQGARESIAQLLFPDALPTSSEIVERYPARALPKGALVTRVGPSPTGAMHIGGLFAGLVSERLAHQSGGVFYLRIEDTDRKREIPGASDVIMESLRFFGIRIDEGPGSGSDEKGDYGPYFQSRRKAIYASLARDLFMKDDAYPCFSTEAELLGVAERQRAAQERPGCYGEYAAWRDRTLDEVQKRLDEGILPVIRLRARGDGSRTIVAHDLIRGEIEFPESDVDVVLLKSDGTPTYHLAHVIDDHLMGTTHVVRGDEWLPSLPLHLDLFSRFEWKPPAYAHFAPIQKMDGTSRRKISKRKDPEAGVEYYMKAGYPPHALIEYLLNLANSDYEAWSKAHPSAPIEQFPVRLDRMGRSGPLFDVAKLESFSREHIASLSIGEKLDALIAWAYRHDREFADAIELDRGYAERVLAIEGTEGRVRKDVAKWSEARAEFGFFFDSLFSLDRSELDLVLPKIDPGSVGTVLDSLRRIAATADSKEEWLDASRGLATSLGYAESVKAYKAAPDAYKGHVGDITQLARVLLTGRRRSPDLFEVMSILGVRRVEARLGSL